MLPEEVEHAEKRAHEDLLNLVEFHTPPPFRRHTNTSTVACFMPEPKRSVQQAKPHLIRWGFASGLFCTYKNLSARRKRAGRAGGVTGVAPRNRRSLHRQT